MDFEDQGYENPSFKHIIVMGFDMQNHTMQDVFIFERYNKVWIRVKGNMITT